VSNFLAIATVTAGLQRLLQAAVDADVPGSTVWTDRPEVREGNSGDPGVNVFLYAVVPNGALRDADLPTRDSSGRVVQRPQAALDLHYLLSFYGSDDDLEPQRLLGSVVRTLHAEPILSPPIVDAVVTAATGHPPIDPFLATTDLADSPELVRFTPLALSLEDMSKLWSVFFQTPYALSVAYGASVVLIDQEVPLSPALPVIERDVVVQTFERPVIGRIVASDSPADPIAATSTILIQGGGLHGDATLVRLAGADRTPVSARSDEVTFDLSTVTITDLAPGPQAVQIVLQVELGDPASPHVGSSSNVATFLLSPTVTGTAVTGTGANGSITVDTDLTVGAEQRVVLALLDTGTLARTQVFPAPERSAGATSVEIPISGVAADDYIAQISVDGAASILESTGGVVDGPKVTIT